MRCVVDMTAEKEIDGELVDQLGKNIVFANLSQIVKGYSAINRACKNIGQHERLDKFPKATLQNITKQCLDLFVSFYR